MKYCENCGAELNDEDMFCLNCGQPVGASNAGPEESAHANTGYQNVQEDIGYHEQKDGSFKFLSTHSLSCISYLWLPGIIISIIANVDRKDPVLNLHINQAIWLFLFWIGCHILLCMGAFLSLFALLSGLGYLALFGLWIYCFIGAVSNKMHKIPYFGDIRFIK